MRRPTFAEVFNWRSFWGLVLVYAIMGLVLLLAGCSSDPKVPTVTFEAEGFLRRYMATRDEFIRRTAPAHARCEKVTPTAPADARLKCEKLAADESAWAAQDTTVMTQLISGQTVRSLDLDKALELGLKLLKAAADVAL